MNTTVLNFDTLESTNTEALRQAQLGAAEGVCIVARRQTAGRGRHGRSWVSPEDAGLYFSIILRPTIETRLLPLITLMAGIAVHDTLHEMGLQPDIKWVNDLLVNDKKISGILAETTDTSSGLAVIVGIGINLRSDNFPSEIAQTATSIRAEIRPVGGVLSTSEPRPAATADLIKRLTRHLAHFYEVLSDIGGPASIRHEWQKRSTYSSGKRVRVLTAAEQIVGVTDGLEDNGALRVRLDDGTVSIVHAGDVERLRQELD